MSSRPTIYGTPASERVEIRLTPAQRAAVQAAAETQGVSMSSVLRELIDERLEDHRPFPGRAVRAVTWDGDDDR